mmetsp:Transcript_5442/g.16106  ORF Transcript_5442/g.16106 Transcript_5442/m.16106 type:complete len:248 (+) Transcript_5442:795-1538(+)
MLRVNREHAHTILLKHRRNDGPARDQRLLVREGDVLLGLDRLDCGDEARATHDPCDDSLGLLVARYRALALRSTQQLGLVARDAQRGHTGRQLIELPLVAGHHLRLELRDLLEKDLDVLPGSERDRLEEAGVLPADVQGLGADAAGGAEDRDPLVLGRHVCGLARVCAHEVPAARPRAGRAPDPPPRDYRGWKHTCQQAAIRQAACQGRTCRASCWVREGRGRAGSGSHSRRGKGHGSPLLWRGVWL